MEKEGSKLVESGKGDGMQRPESDIRFIAMQVWAQTCTLIPSDPDDADRVFKVVLDLQKWCSGGADLKEEATTS